MFEEISSLADQALCDPVSQVKSSDIEHWKKDGSECEAIIPQVKSTREPKQPITTIKLKDGIILADINAKFKKLSGNVHLREQSNAYENLDHQYVATKNFLERSELLTSKPQVNSTREPKQPKLIKTKAGPINVAELRAKFERFSENKKLQEQSGAYKKNEQSYVKRWKEAEKAKQEALTRWKEEEKAKQEALKRWKKEEKAKLQALKRLKEEEKAKNEALTRCQEEVKAKQEALTRLSEQMSLKLADNNPNIADLSDINRPTNLAEKISMLYDDQWTEAFEALQKRPEFQEEEKAIKQLLAFLMVCYRICHEQATRQLSAMFSVQITMTLSEQVSTEVTLPSEMKKLIKETRKKHAAFYLPALHDLTFDALCKDNKGLLDDDAVRTYIKQCTELCWLMCVQDPPMALLVDVGEDRKYSRTKFKEYTKLGPFIDYVVWPAVLIQEGGDMMAKGVAQCCSEMSEAKGETKVNEKEITTERLTSAMGNAHAQVTIESTEMENKNVEELHREKANGDSLNLSQKETVTSSQIKEHIQRRNNELNEQSVEQNENDFSLSKDNENGEDEVNSHAEDNASTTLDTDSATDKQFSSVEQENETPSSNIQEQNNCRNDEVNDQPVEKNENELSSCKENENFKGEVNSHSEGNASTTRITDSVTDKQLFDDIEQENETTKEKEPSSSKDIQNVEDNSLVEDNASTTRDKDSTIDKQSCDDIVGQRNETTFSNTQEQSNRRNVEVKEQPVEKNDNDFSSTKDNENVESGVNSHEGDNISTTLDTDSATDKQSGAEIVDQEKKQLLVK